MSFVLLKCMVHQNWTVAWRKTGPRALQSGDRQQAARLWRGSCSRRGRDPEWLRARSRMGARGRPASRWESSFRI